MKIRNQLAVTATVIAAACTWALFSQPASAQVTVFSDNFTNGSTTNSGNAPTTSPDSTSYDTAGAKPYSASIGANDLNLSLSSTSGGGLEAEALFTSSPVTLVNIGDYIDYQLTFVDTSNLLANASNFIYIGLYDSYGVAPLTTVSTNISTFVTGGVQNWQGYVGKVAPSLGSSKNYTRPKQTAGADQDLVGNGISTSLTYDNPQGIQLNGANTAATATPTNGGTYTLDFRISINGSGVLAASNTLYAGVGTGGTILSDVSGTAPGAVGTATNLTQTFDGLAFGWYQKGSVASALDVDSIVITIPEPSTLLLLTAGLAMMVGLVSRRRRS